VYFGEGAHGVQAAAWTYFRAEAADLDLAQAALLAAIIRAPEALTPTRAADAALVRRDDVLRRMAADGRITEDERDAALATPIEVHARPQAPETREPHFVDLVVRTLLADPRFGATEAERATRLYEGGLEVHTTLRPDLQALARSTLAHHLPDASDPDAAIAVVDPATGHVLAAAGSRTYEELQFDLATQARRQPGSTFKTFVLAGAIADGHHPDELLDGRQGAVPVAGGGAWEVRNYDRRSYPNVTLAGATRASVNAAFARLGGELGIPRVAGLATAMGVRSRVPDDDPQITIGGGRLAVTPLDLAAAYGTLANLGHHVPTTPITRIDDDRGTTVWLPDTAGTPVLAASAAHVTTEVLRDVVERGTALAARVPGWEVAGKTGTTSDHVDAWFVGYTPVLSTAVWMGHAEGRVPMIDVRGIRRVTGGTLPARIFADFTAAALADVEPGPLPAPRRRVRAGRHRPALGPASPPTGARGGRNGSRGSSSPARPAPSPRRLPQRRGPSPPRHPHLRRRHRHRGPPTSIRSPNRGTTRRTRRRTRRPLRSPPPPRLPTATPRPPRTRGPPPGPEDPTARPRGSLGGSRPLADGQVPSPSTR
jgi:penicillin-binding protein 1A